MNETSEMPAPIVAALRQEGDAWDCAGHHYLAHLLHGAADEIESLRVSRTEITAQRIVVAPTMAHARRHGYARGWRILTQPAQARGVVIHPGDQVVYVGWGDDNLTSSAFDRRDAITDMLRVAAATGGAQWSGVVS